jgi:hypothetical protein
MNSAEVPESFSSRRKNGKEKAGMETRSEKGYFGEISVLSGDYHT